MDKIDLMDDDDDENDSDYKEEDEEKDNESLPDKATERKLTAMTSKRKGEINDIYSEMKQNYMNEVKEKISKAHKTERIVIKSKYKNGSIELMLSSIFNNSSEDVNKEILQNSKKDCFKVVEEDTNLKLNILKAVKGLKQKEKVKEKRKFAGKEIIIEKTQTAENKKIEENKKKSALDEVLETIKGPKVISTITKSSVDWDNFKQKENLEDSLAIAQKDGYLTKQDFLTRCDFREFEKERDERNLKRANTSSDDNLL